MTLHFTLEAIAAFALCVCWTTGILLLSLPTKSTVQDRPSEDVCNLLIHLIQVLKGIIKTSILTPQELPLNNKMADVPSNLLICIMLIVVKKSLLPCRTSRCKFKVLSILASWLAC